MVKNEGHITWDDITPPTNLIIHVDANSQPLDNLTTVLHELIHVIFYAMFVGRMDDSFQEVGVEAYEKYMYNYVKRSPARRAKWEELIKKKIGEVKDAERDRGSSERL